jgi:hypothetical protein
MAMTWLSTWPQFPSTAPAGRGCHRCGFHSIWFFQRGSAQSAVNPCLADTALNLLQIKHLFASQTLPEISVHLGTLNGQIEMASNNKETSTAAKS